MLVLGTKWERLGVNIQVVPSTAAGNHLGIGWESKFWWFPALVLGSGNQPADGKSGPPQAEKI